MLCWLLKKKSLFCSVSPCCEDVFLPFEPCVPIHTLDSHAFALQRLDRIIDHRLSPAFLYLFTNSITPHRFHTHSLTLTHNKLHSSAKKKKKENPHTPPPPKNRSNPFPSSQHPICPFSPSPSPFPLLPSPSSLSFSTSSLPFHDSIHPRSTHHPPSCHISTLYAFLPRFIPTSPHLTVV